MVFIIVMLCFASTITAFINIVETNTGGLEIVFEDNYYLGDNYGYKTRSIINNELVPLIKYYKGEEYIKEGNTVTVEEIKDKKEDLFREFRNSSDRYNHKLSDEENYKVFEEAYADKISKIKGRLIGRDLNDYNSLLRRLQSHEGLVYYASDGDNVISNKLSITMNNFKDYPAYILFNNFEEEVYPREFERNDMYYSIRSNINELDRENSKVYIGFTEKYLNGRIKEWEEDKAIVTKNLYVISGFLLGLFISFIYLILIVGRRSFKDKEIQWNFVDKIYTDINLMICAGLIAIWVGCIDFLFDRDVYEIIFVITFLIGTLGLILGLSLVKHLKNRTILKHTLIYKIFHSIFKFIKSVYDSGSVGVKIISVVIGYPILVASTFFMFPITIGVAAWFGLKKVKEFNSIKEGVQKVKEGHIQHKIDLPGKGEFSELAENINSITDGLNKAVENELKSERLKTELITNVSHDIRTPLTSIITYVDLLKQEENEDKEKEYIEIIDQKSQKLKMLTDDLFEASKASSGNMPVNFEKIDIISLITQGLGELNDQIEASELQFKLNPSKEKVYVYADGKLLWRAIENLLSNIFKYALHGSRVYIDIKNLDDEIILEMKNISSYELNISSEELMERFKRGDESRSSEGSGLGLSIAKSLIELQRGSFNIEIDGDLFKAIISLQKHD